jgi:hypothetical protein
MLIIYLFISNLINLHKIIISFLNIYNYLANQFQELYVFFKNITTNKLTLL